MDEQQLKSLKAQIIRERNQLKHLLLVEEDLVKKLKANKRLIRLQENKILELSNKPIKYEKEKKTKWKKKRWKLWK